MRKCRLLLGMFLISVLCMTGCGEKEPAENLPDKDVGIPIVSEDWELGNATRLWKRQLMKTELGHYYYDWTAHAMYYYDYATQKVMYLCNKPECTHDGNKFCVATNAAYTHVAHCMNGGLIYVAAWEETETQHQLKILTMTTDGSELSELVTVYTLEKTGTDMGFYSPHLTIHRGYALLPIEFYGVEGSGVDYSMAGEHYRGTAVINLKTKEVAYLDEEAFRMDNREIERVSACGDYFYYTLKEKKKTVLHYYDFEKKEDNECKLLTNFTGQYAVVDEKTVVYTRNMGRNLCCYDMETGENLDELQGDTFTVKTRSDVVLSNGGKEVEESWQKVRSCSVYSDGTYVYVPLSGVSLKSTGEITAYLNVYDKDFRMVVQVEIGEEIRKLTEITQLVELEEGYNREGAIIIGGVYSSCTDLFQYTGEEIYYAYPNIESTEVCVYRLKREELLAGTPKFEFLYWGNKSETDKR